MDVAVFNWEHVGAHSPLREAANDNDRLDITLARRVGSLDACGHLMRVRKGF